MSVLCGGDIGGELERAWDVQGIELPVKPRAREGQESEQAGPGVSEKRWIRRPRAQEKHSFPTSWTAALKAGAA